MGQNDPITVELPQEVALSFSRMLTHALTRATHAETTRIGGWIVGVRCENFGSTVYVHLRPPQTPADATSSPLSDPNTQVESQD